MESSAAQSPASPARVWVEFEDPAEPAQRFRLDLTWLTSGYRCIFGAGCRGLSAQRPHDGCCGLGAHFCDADDLARVAGVVAELTDDTWQFADLARASNDRGGAGEAVPAADAAGPHAGWTELEDGERKTRVVDGACILLNREGFPGGAGCALHAHALRQGRSPVQTKPDVCWQLPLYRDYRTVELPDESSYLEVTIGEYERGRWGPGGHDFDWYCSGSALAHGHDEPLYVSHADELTELMGAAGYAELVRHCDAHLAAARALDAGPTRALLPLFVHPATLAAHGGRALGRDRSAHGDQGEGSEHEGGEEPT